MDRRRCDGKTGIDALKRGWELWRQPGLVSKRVALATAGEAESNRRVAPSLAIRLNQPLTIDAMVTLMISV